MDPGQRLATRLKTLRERLGLTQTRMARKLRISQATLNRLESGSQNVTLRTLAGLARALRCDVTELFLAPQPREGRRRGAIRRGRGGRR